MASSGPGMPLKLKINTGQGNTPLPSAGSPPPSTGLKLSFKPIPTPTTSTPSAPIPAKRKYTKKDKPASKAASKKRTRDDDEDELAGGPKPGKKQALGIKLKTDAISSPSTILKLKTPNSIRAHPLGVPRLKIKHKGKPPVRPVGVGYDSEASDAEADPAIEENFVLRMAPGPDCDYLRQAIIDGKIGAKMSEGGANVAFKFFQRDGRRACVTVQNHHYAAILVDLPCVVESLKSWDKRGWWKSADISQMLVVLPGILKTEEEAKTAPLPKEWKVDEKLWQWPHGLTPPMRSCRSRRFRKRVSHRTIEKAEEEVERLLALDEKAKASKGGKTQYEIVDLDRMKSQDVESQDENDEDDEDELGDDGDDAEGEDDVEFGEQDAAGEDEEEEDPEALAARMELELVGGDDDGGDPEPAAATTPAALPSATAPSTPAAATPAEESTSAAVSEDGEGEDEGDNDDEDEEQDESGDDDESDDDADDETKEKAHFQAQQREEIAHLEREVAAAKETLGKQGNPLFRQRIMTKIKSLEADLEVKRRALGEDGEDDA